MEDTHPKQAKVSVYFACQRVINNSTEYLIYTRLKNPFYGCQGFPSGKVEYGETVNQAAIRELKEETNLVGVPNIILIKHFLVYDKKTKKLVEDKFMFLALIDNPIGDLIPCDEGKYEWIREEDLSTYVTNHFESFEEFMKEIEYMKTFDGSIKFLEIEQFSEKF